VTAPDYRAGLTPQRIESVTVSQVYGLDVFERVRHLLGEDLNTTLRNTLLALAPRQRPAEPDLPMRGPRDVARAEGERSRREAHLDVFDARAGRITAEVFDAVSAFESAAVALRRTVESASTRRRTLVAGLHAAAAERERAAAKAEERRVQEAAQLKAWQDRIARARLCAEQNGLELERVPSYPEPQDEAARRWRLSTDNRGHRFLPGPYDLAGWREVRAVLVSGRGRVYVLPGAEGTLAAIERWLAHHVPGWAA